MAEKGNIKNNIIKLVAPICLLIGSIINILDNFTYIPFALQICATVLLLIAVIFLVINLVNIIRDKKKNK